MPVDGPPRWELTITSGNSDMMARPRASPLRATPGPDDDVTPRCPAYEAPIAVQIAAISSSAWNVVTSYSLIRDRKWSTGLAGVIGYEPKNIGRLANCAPATSPSAIVSPPV